jgi:hypothetical protein
MYKFAQHGLASLALLEDGEPRSDSPWGDLRAAARNCLADCVLGAGAHVRGHAPQSLAAFRTGSQMHRYLAKWVVGALIGGCVAAAASAATHPALLPPGWTARPVPGKQNVIQYVSPDRRAVLTMRDVAARSATLSAAIDRVAARPDERVTYQKRGRDWFVVSGFRSGEIFYRRVNLACRGSRWHFIQLEYPRADKRRMDATVTSISHRLQRFNNVCPR